MTRTKTPETPTLPEGFQSDPQDRSLWTRPWFVLSALLVLLLIAAAVWLIVDDPDSSAPAGTAPHPVSVSAGCGPDGDGQQLPPSAPPVTSWRLIGTMAAPTDTDTGPARETDGVPLCYSPDPVGALFAAATFVATSSDPALRLPVLDRLAAPGAGRDAAIASILPCPEGQTSGCGRGPGGSTPGVQIAGFAFTSYTAGSDAVIDLALTYQGALVHLPLQLRWLDDDWRVVIPVTGSPFDGLGPLPTLAGYVPWQGA